ncbi:MAG: sulfatase-like hydrolase/transferase [Chloroflexi bacterium]|nr:sulfatase-like hydrolase/transferase [Chloroflexota bacterium]
MPQRPNIVVLLADDHRRDSLGIYGESQVSTPHLDALAASGMRCSRMHIMGGFSGAVCVPARASVMTGCNPFRAAAHVDLARPASNEMINPDLPLLPQAFRLAGYHTHAIGKWHNDRASFNRAFASGEALFFGGMSDHWNVPVQPYDPTGAYSLQARSIASEFSTDVFGNAAIRFLCDYQRSEPFFLYVAFTAPHDPRRAPTEVRARYDAARITRPPNVWPQHPFDNGDLTVRDEFLAPSPRTPEVVREHLADYYAMITHLDGKIGEILRTLAARPDGKNTIVVYTADHGLALGQHGLFGKQNLYEHSICIPCLLAGPGIPAGIDISGLTCPVDIYPTLCDLTGLLIPHTVEGQSLAQIFSTPSEGRTAVFSVFREVQRAVNTGNWKFIRYYRSPFRPAGTDRVQLFDLRNDPWEMHDLSSVPAQAERVAALSTQLLSWQRTVRDPLVV